MNKDLTRRDFLGRVSLYGGSLSIAMMTQLPLAAAAAAKSQSPEVLTKSEWCAVQAITGRIIPSDETPGAIEANCVNFIDKALANEEASALGMVRQHIKALDQHCLATRDKVFCELAPAQQDTLLIALEDNQIESWPTAAGTSAQFFGLIRALTIIGFLAEPKYGGNRSYSGWQLAGYPGPRHHRGGYTAAQMLGEESIEPIWKT